MTSIYGYFEDDGTIPAFDPGLEVECPICHQQLSEPVVTASFLVPYNVDDFVNGKENKEGLRSYFYRMHHSCIRSHPREEQLRIESEIEGPMIDAICKARERN